MVCLWALMFFLGGHLQNYYEASVASHSCTFCNATQQIPMAGLTPLPFSPQSYEPATDKNEAVLAMCRIS